jgi:diguanylate cyclase (GGDEF)-like protein
LSFTSRTAWFGLEVTLDERTASMQLRRNGQKYAVLALDLDGFKHVNDPYGHATGDELLRCAAGRLRNVLSSGDMAARLGGDEFAVLLTAGSGGEMAVSPAELIIREVSEPYQFAPKSIIINVSVGIAIAPGDGDALMRAADDASYEAKRSGKGQYRLAKPETRKLVPPIGEYAVAQHQPI